MVSNLNASKTSFKKLGYVEKNIFAEVAVAKCTLKYKNVKGMAT